MSELFVVPRNVRTMRDIDVSAVEIADAVHPLGDKFRALAKVVTDRLREALIGEGMSKIQAEVLAHQVAQRLAEVGAAAEDLSMACVKVTEILQDVRVETRSVRDSRSNGAFRIDA